VKPADRIQISDLIAKYTLEPLIRDVYVEGDRDQSFFNWLIPKMGLPSDVSVLPIRAIDVPRHLVQSHAFTRTGEHEELITLALELNRSLASYPPHVTCVADAEFDHLLSRPRQATGLVYTDGSSLEAYAYRAEVVTKFLSLLAPFPFDANHVLQQIGPVLQERFLIRAANEQLGWEMSWLEKLGTAKVNKDSGTLEFDSAAFIHAYLQKNARFSEEQRFRKCLETLRTRVTHPTWASLCGHDYAAILAHFIRPFLPPGLRDFRSGAFCERSLMMCLEAADISREPMFAALRARLA